jgi:hypothetical protein
MTREAIISAVKAKIDEVHPLQAGATIADPQIDLQLDNAAVTLVEMLPSVLAYPATATPSVDNFIQGQSIDVVCPADFVRLHRIKLDYWNAPVTELIPDTGRLAEVQMYKYLASTVNRPAAGLYSKGVQTVIRCYPPPDEGGECVEEFIYVQRPSVAEDLNDGLIDLLAWQAAAIIYAIHGQGDSSALCETRLKALIDAKLKYRS